MFYMAMLYVKVLRGVCMKHLAMSVITTGEQIPNTNLHRRFRGKKEITPIFIPENSRLTLQEQTDIAFPQALSVGWKSVSVAGIVYGFLGEWVDLGEEVCGK